MGVTAQNDTVAGAAPSGGNLNFNPSTPAAPPAPSLASGRRRDASSARPSQQEWNAADARSGYEPGESNGVALGAVTADADAFMSPSDRGLARLLRRLLVGTYSLVWLLVLLYLAYRYWRWKQQSAAAARRNLNT